ncbi:MAG: phosphate signaling complex protein PhoU [Actinomycetota bacterium]|nr:phosphate signaling complex protein PhoU [Actinomycetota bacterium]
MSSSIRQRFDESLDQLKRDSIHMAGLVLENIRRTSEAILENRLRLVAEVINADDEVDRRYSKLEQDVFELAARQQPTAGDLRFLISLTRIVHELERSGDLAVNTVKALNRSAGFDLPPRIRATLSHLCDDTAAIFRAGIDALADMEADAGAALDAQDDAIDDLIDSLYEALLSSENSIPRDVALELALVARYMERIADHAVNIGDHVSYIVTGVFPQHEHLKASGG